MIQIIIAMIIGAILSWWAKPIIADAKKDAEIASLKAFGDECGDIILKQKDVIDSLKFNRKA